MSGAHRWRRAAGAPTLGAVVAAACGAPDVEPLEVQAGCAPGTICTWMGTPGLAGLAAPREPAAPRHRTEELLYMVQDVEVASDGTVYVADFNNHRVVRVDADGLVTVVSGQGRPGDGVLFGDCSGGCPASGADMWHPSDIVLDPSTPGVLLVVAWQNHRVLRIDPAADEVRWLAGIGEPAYGVDPVAFAFPSSVVADEDGTLYVADQANQVVRRLGVDGAVRDVAGAPGIAGYAGDGGPADAALLHGHLGWEGGPTSKLGLDGRTLYLADSLNGVIRAVDLDSGLIERVAGRFVPDGESTASAEGYSGDGGDALDAVFWRPRDVEVGPDGTLYVADTGNHCVRAVSPDGVVETVAGRCGAPGYDGDGGLPTDALLDTPCGVALDHGGNLYIADSNNHLVRKITR